MWPQNPTKKLTHLVDLNTNCSPVWQPSSVINNLFGCMTYANVNGHLSAPIYIGRGLHQGRPLSPILFIIEAQIFTNKLKNNTDIKGIKVSGVDILLSLFADDTDIFLEASIECVEAVFSVLAEFGINSGCKGNIDKTTCIPLGKARSNSHLLGQIANKNYGRTLFRTRLRRLG